MKFSTYSCIEVQYNDSVRNKMLFYLHTVYTVFIHTYIESISGMPFELYIYVFTHTVRSYIQIHMHTYMYSYAVEAFIS